MEVSAQEADSLWQASFSETPRPELYTSTTYNEDGFLPLNDPQEFVADISTMTHTQLYAAAQNGQLALKMAQDEYLTLNTLMSQIRGKTRRVNPQALDDDDIFEKVKEAQLYGYKYEVSRPALYNANADCISEQEKRDVQLPQDPFQQGGFVPTDKQYRAMLSKLPKNAKDKDIKNLDGWTPIEKNGVRLIPRRQIHHEEYDRSMLSQRHTELERPDTANRDDSQFTPSHVVDRRLARVNGQKRPLPADLYEGPYPLSGLRGDQPATPSGSNAHFHLRDGNDSPTPRRRKLETPQPSASTKSKARPTEATASIKLEPLPTETLLARKWKADDLVAYLRYDHLWLSPDPQEALKIKESVLQAENPVRSWSMHRTWGTWKRTGKDKRPRNKDGTERKSTVRKADTVTGKMSGQDSPAPQLSRRNSLAGTATPVANGHQQPEMNDALLNGKVANTSQAVEAQAQAYTVGSDVATALAAPVWPPTTINKEESIAGTPKRKRSVDSSQSESPRRRKSIDMGRADVGNPVTPMRRSLRTTQRGST